MTPVSLSGAQKLSTSPEIRLVDRQCRMQLKIKEAFPMNDSRVDGDPYAGSSLPSGEETSGDSKWANTQ
jgi:hypothetical protein